MSVKFTGPVRDIIVIIVIIHHHHQDDIKATIFYEKLCLQINLI